MNIRWLLGNAVVFKQSEIPYQQTCSMFSSSFFQNTAALPKFSVIKLTCVVVWSMKYIATHPEARNQLIAEWSFHLLSAAFLCSNHFQRIKGHSSRRKCKWKLKSRGQEICKLKTITGENNFKFGVKDFFLAVTHNYDTISPWKKGKDSKA